MMTTTESELRRHLAGAAGEWIEQAGAAAGEHPDLDQLMAYHAGELAAEEEARLQDHLLTCRSCLDHLLELDAFTAPAAEEAVPARPGPASSVADFETAAAWRALRPRLPVAAKGLPRWAPALAAGLALAVLGLGFFSLHQQRRMSALGAQLAALSQPQAGPAIVDVYPASAVRGEGEPAPLAELPASGFTTLVLNLPAGVRHAAYEVEILDAAGQLRWAGGGLEASRFGTLRLGVPEGFLGPGEHALRLYGRDDKRRDSEEKIWIETYSLRVAAP